MARAASPRLANAAVGNHPVRLLCLADGPLYGTAMSVTVAQDLIMLASNGVSNRLAVSDIRETGRAASGVILMSLDEGHKLVSATTSLRMEDEAVEVEIAQS